MGDCGQVTCEPGHGSNSDNCTRIVEHTHKFYLSFENSLCKDYVTEKLFARINMNVVPVVMGGGPYSDVTPPHSVIDTANFESPKKLAEYLIWLDKHPEEYLSYFWWKDYYEVESSGLKLAACELCRKLHSETEEPAVYNDLYQWWVEDAECMSWTHVSLKDKLTHRARKTKLWKLLHNHSSY